MRYFTPPRYLGANVDFFRLYGGAFAITTVLLPLPVAGGARHTRDQALAPAGFAPHHGSSRTNTTEGSSSASRAISGAQPICASTVAAKNSPDVTMRPRVY